MPSSTRQPRADAYGDGNDIVIVEDTAHNAIPGLPQSLSRYYNNIVQNMMANIIIQELPQSLS